MSGGSRRWCRGRVATPVARETAPSTKKKGQPAFQNMLTTSELAPSSALTHLTTEASQGRAISADYPGVFRTINGGPDHRGDRHHDDHRGDPDHRGDHHRARAR